MLRDPYRTVRVRRESGRLLSHVSHLSGVPVADVPAAVIAARGGPERAAAELLRRRAAALGLGDAVKGAATMNLDDQRQRVEESEQREREASDHAAAERRKLLGAELIAVCKDLAKVDPEGAYQIMTRVAVTFERNKYKRVAAVVNSIRNALSEYSTEPER